MKKDLLGIVYLCAGLSTRFGGISKPLQRIKGKKTLIEFSMDQALRAGFKRIWIIVNPFNENEFKEVLGGSYKGAPITYFKQSYSPHEREKPWGQVDALCLLIRDIDCPFVVCNGDDLYGVENLKLLYNHLICSAENQERQIATISYPLNKVLSKKGKVNRGVIMDDDGHIEGIDEVKKISLANLKKKGLTKESPVSMGIFALYPEDIKEMYGDLINFKRKHKGNKTIEYPFGTCFTKLITEGRISIATYPSKSEWIGLTYKEDIEDVKKFLRKQNQE